VGVRDWARREATWWSLFLIALSDISSSIYFFSGFAVAASGQWLLHVYLLALAYFASSIALQIDAASRYPVTGSAYSVVKDGLGYSAANIVSTIFLTGNLIMAAYGAVGAAEYLSHYLGTDGFTRVVIVLVSIAVAALVAVRGVELMGFLALTFAVLNTATVIAILPLVRVGEQVGLGDFVAGFAYAVKMFIGVEVLSQHAGELVRPRRSIAAAGSSLFIASAVTAVVFALAAPSLGVSLGEARGYLVLELASRSPVGQLAAPVSLVSAVIVELMAAVAGLSVFARTLYALAVDGFAPRVFASLHRRFRTPYRAVVAGALISAVTALFGPDVVAELYGLTSMVGYLVMAVAVILVGKRMGAVSGVVPGLAIPIMHILVAVPSIALVAVGTPLSLLPLVAMALFSITYVRIRGSTR